ncbi:MAG: SGNH/GDSL hydrolase family protein [Blastocatellales bacterium]
MKYRLFSAVCSALLILTVFAQQRPATPNPAMEPIEDAPGLPRVLLIGDSISIGYTVPVRELLRGKANVHRIPENGGNTKRGLEKLSGWLGNGKWDVIHFNWGLHDLRLDEGRHAVPLPEYEANLRALVKQLKVTGAKLIWCSTTPVPEGDLNPPRRSADVIAYNEAAQKVMRENGIETDDLYAFVNPILGRLQLPANVHFKPEGSAELAKQVAASLEKALHAETR